MVKYYVICVSDYGAYKIKTGLKEKFVKIYTDGADKDHPAETEVSKEQFEHYSNLQKDLDAQGGMTHFEFRVDEKKSTKKKRGD